MWRKLNDLELNVKLNILMKLGSAVIQICLATVNSFSQNPRYKLLLRLFWLMQYFGFSEYVQGKSRYRKYSLNHNIFLRLLVFWLRHFGEDNQSSFYYFIIKHHWRSTLMVQLQDFLDRSTKSETKCHDYFVMQTIFMKKETQETVELW